MASTGSVVRPEDVREWGQQLDAVARRIGARFARSETRDRVRAYLVGLLGPVQRKNSWQVAEQIGDDDPYGVQHLLGRSDWDPDEVRDDLRAYVVEALGDPDAVLILDETGFLKKGTQSAGVARQYTGTAGRIENAQVGVFLAYASRHGTAFLDRALYLPKEWTDDPDRCKKAGIPEGTAFATKIRLAKAMLERAFAAGVPAAWVTGDEVYGSDWRPAAVAGGGGAAVRAGGPGQPVRLGGLPAGHGRRPGEALPKRAWHKITIAAGSKGPRRYAWAWVADQPRPGAEVAALAAGPQGPRRPRGAGLLHRGRPGAHDADPVGRRRPGLDGRSRAASSRPSRRSGWPTTRCGAGRAGIGTSRWRCWPTPSWRRCGSWRTGRRKKVGGRAGADRVDGPGGPPAAGAAAVEPPAGGRGGAGLVGVAAGPSGVRATMPLQETRGRAAGLVTTVVLVPFGRAGLERALKRYNICTNDH